MSQTSTPEIALKVIAKAKAERATKLQLGRCGLTEIPQEVLELDWLEELDLRDSWWEDGKRVFAENEGEYNFIERISHLRVLKKLRVLYIEGNWSGEQAIREIPENSLPDSLEVLDLSYNYISEIKGLEKLTRLSQLDLSGNQISEIKGLEKLTRLSQLDLSGNQISEIKGLEKLTQLSQLDLYSNQISEIKGLEKLTQLSQLGLYFNQISEIKGLEKLTLLSHLDLEGNQISQIKGLEELTLLSHLNLFGNQISQINGLEKLTLLSFLDLSGNQISEIKGLEKLTLLSHLDLSGNQISEIKGLEKLTQLFHLSLSDNQISEIKSLENLTKLKELKLGSRKINEIKGLEHLTGLSSLFISSSKIREIKGLDKLTSLTSLSLDRNEINEIKGLEQLTNLKSLNLSSNKISEIKGLKQLSNLNELSIDWNQISEINGLEQLSNLKSLNISSNKIRELKNLEQHTKLINLILNENQVSEIKGLDNLPFLKVLMISNNKLTTVNALRKISSLTYLSLFGNRLKDLPQELLGNNIGYNCLKDIQNWWAELDTSPVKIPNRLVKLQVTGNGNAGKSSLIEALKMGICKKDMISTHGIIIESLTYEVGTTQHQFQVWDFGGQEIYHGTHQLFISSESLQLIVSEAGTEQQAAAGTKIPDRVKKNELIQVQPLQHYINLARRQSPLSPVLVVQNKIDNADSPKDPALYSVAAKNQVDFLTASATKGIGIETLRAKLAETATNLLQYGMLMPKSWIDVRQFFIDNLNEPAITRKTIISATDFETLCSKYKVLPKAVSSLKKYLHHSGLIYYHEKLLKDLIIADQRWALEAIYRPLDRGSPFYDQMRNDLKGRVRAKNLFRAFGDNYTLTQKQLFLQFMKSCGLCFSLERADEETEETYYIFPEFLPDDETPSAKNIWSHAQETDTYRYNLEYLDYFRVQRFIVSIGNKTPLEYIWKNGIVVSTEKGLFRVDADRARPGIVITIEKKAIKNYLWPIIKDFNENSREKGKWFAIHSSSDEIIIDLETLEREHNAGKAPGLESDDGNRNGNDKTQESQVSLVNSLPDVPQYRPKRLVLSYASENILDREDLEKCLSNYEDNGQLQILYDAEVVDGRKPWDDSITEMFYDADGFIILVSQDYQFVKKKKYIWEKEIPIITDRFNGERIFTFCLSVAPAIYNDKIKKFPAFRNGKDILPESGHLRDQYLVDFAKQIIEEKFLKVK